jgi:CDP-diacylglycerol--glycerol-3-phosphate 3-phosphatidyltransferase
LNLPNLVTVWRLILAGVLFVLLETACRGETGTIWYIAFALYLITVLSDGLDGYLARSRGQITAFGRIADPLADKILICGVLVLALSIPVTSHLVPTWIVLLVLAREFLVSGLRGFLEARGTSFAAKWEGKTKLVVQAIYCGTVLFYPGHQWGWVEVVARICLYATALITVYSGLSYIRKARDVMRGGADI